MEKYWDSRADIVIQEQGGSVLVVENFVKRRGQISRLLRYSDHIYKKDVLEVGPGAGILGKMLSMCYCDGIKYRASELSPHFAEMARRIYKLDISVGEIRNLDYPTSSFDSCIIFDVLEHVPVGHRSDAAKEISRVLRDDAMLFCHIPLSESGHEQHEYGFSLIDLAAFSADAGLWIIDYEKYTVMTYGGLERSYGWCVLARPKDKHNCQRMAP